MNRKQSIILGRSVPAPSGRAVIGDMQGAYVRIAELDVDPDRLDAYRAAVTEEIETSLRIEPGVLALYAVSDKDHPAHITVFEIYADEDAYNAHLATPHFKHYKAATLDIVKSLKLRETTPIVLGAKT